MAAPRDVGVMEDPAISLMTRLALAISVSAALAASASAAPAPDLARIAGTPAPARGAIYAACLAQAATAQTFDRTSAKGAHLLRFTCSGAPARAFWDELAGWSAAHDAQWTSDGRTWRSTGKIAHDLFGTDYCSNDGAADYKCEITVNVGAFLDG